MSDMSDDEKAIRDLVARWMTASEQGDTDTVLGLMTDDVVFMTPGREPFGKEEFYAASQGMKGAAMNIKSEIRELKIHGDVAFTRSYFDVTVTPPNGEPVQRKGYALTLFHKQNGRWLLTRDANLLTKA